MVKRLSLGRGKPLSAWHPVVEFRADGKTLRYEGSTVCRSEQVQVGERVDILYDAEDPSHYHLEGLSEWEATGDRVTVGFGILWIVIAGVIAVIASQ